LKNFIQKLFGHAAQTEKAQSIVAEASALSTLQAMQSLADWLERDIEQHPSKDKLLILQSVNGELRALIEAALANMVDSHANFARLSVLLKASRHFATRILAAYAAALRDEAPALAKKPGNTLLIRESIANWMYWVGRNYLLCYVQERNLHSLPWQKVGGLMAFSNNLPEDVATQTKYGETKSEIDKALARLLILARTLTTDFHGRALLIADSLAEFMSVFVVVNNSAISATPDYRTFEDNANRASPDARDDQAALLGCHYGLLACRKELLDLEAMIMEQQKVPAKIDPNQLLNVPETLSVIRYLKNRWGGVEVKRVAERRQVKGKLQISYGLDGIHGLGAAKEAERWALESEVGAILRVEALAKEQESDEALKIKVDEHTQEAEAIDMSSSGIGFEITGGRKPATVGDLICLRTGKDPKWHLGIIRRVFTERFPAQTVGVQLISSKPESVRLIAKGEALTIGAESDAEFKAAKKVVYARPEPKNDHQHLLISVDPDLELGSHYAALLTEGGDKLLRVNALQEVGIGRVVYRCEQVA
jgi:hypothetical protein